MPWESVEQTAGRIARGEIAVLVDDVRAGHGSLVMAADRATPEAVNFMLRFGRGVVCMPVDARRLEELRIHAMVTSGTSLNETRFTVSIDHASCRTGISAHERALTIRKVADPSSGPLDFVRPGHIFPLQAHEGGVLQKPGSAEAAVELARLAGRYPAAVLCDVLDDEGAAASSDELRRFASRHGLPVVTIGQVVDDRLGRGAVVRHRASASVPTEHGVFRALAYESLLDGRTLIAHVLGEPRGAVGALVYVHRECFAGDVLGSVACDCSSKLRHALRTIGDAGAGVVVYVRACEEPEAALRHGAGSAEEGHRSDVREPALVAQVLRGVGVTAPRLMAGSAADLASLERAGLRVRTDPLPELPETMSPPRPQMDDGVAAPAVVSPSNKLC